MNDFKITLAAARVNAGMTQEEVAKEMHVSKKHNSKLGKWKS